MTNNDILRRLRFSFEFNNNQMKAIFQLADLNVSLTLIEQWLKKEDDEAFIAINDLNFAIFLNGLIYHYRGKQEGKSRPPEKRLTNNIILNKLKIALNLKAEDIIDMLDKVDFALSKPELSAIFRKPDHKHFRECKDQLLRNFLSAIQLKYRKSPLPNSPQQPEESTTVVSSRHEKKARPQSERTARPNASKLYVNPNAKKVEKKRKVLKIKPSDIWKDS